MGDNGGHFHHPSKAFDRVNTEYEEFSPNDMTMERRNGVQATGGMCPPKRKNFIGSFFGSIASIFTSKSKKKGEPTIVSDPGGVNGSPDGGVTNSKTGTLASTFSTLRDKLFNPKHRGPRRTRRKPKKPRVEASSINVDDIQKAGEVDKQNRIDLPPKTFIEEGNSDAIFLPDIRGTENVESYLPFHDSIADFGHQGSFAEMGEARGSTLSFAGLSPSQKGKNFQPNSPSFQNRRRDNAAAKKQFGNFLKTKPVPTATPTVQLSPMSSAQGSQKSNVSKPTARPLTSNTNDSAEKRYSLDGKLDQNRESRSRDHEMHTEVQSSNKKLSVSRRPDLPQVPPPAPEKTPKRELPQVPPRVVQKQHTIEGPDMPTIGVDDRSKIDSGITFGILDPTNDRRSAMTEFEPDLGSSGNSGRKKKDSNQEVLPKVQTKNQKAQTEVPPTPSLDQFMLPQGSNRKVSEVPEDVLLPSPNIKKSPGGFRNSFSNFTGILSSSKHSKKLKNSKKKKSKNKQQDKFEEVDVPPSPYLPNSPSGSFMAGSPVSSLNGPSDRKVSDIGDDNGKSLSSSKRGGMFAFDFLTSKRKKKEKQLEDISRREKKGDNELSVNTDML